MLALYWKLAVSLYTICYEEDEQMDSNSLKKYILKQHLIVPGIGGEDKFSNLLIRSWRFHSKIVYLICITYVKSMIYLFDRNTLFSLFATMAAIIFLNQFLRRKNETTWSIINCVRLWFQWNTWNNQKTKIVNKLAFHTAQYFILNYLPTWWFSIFTVINLDYFRFQFF